MRIDLEANRDLTFGLVESLSLQGELRFGGMSRFEVGIDFQGFGQELLDFFTGTFAAAQGQPQERLRVFGIQFQDVGKYRGCFSRVVLFQEQVAPGHPGFKVLGVLLGHLFEKTVGLFVLLQMVQCLGRQTQPVTSCTSAIVHRGERAPDSG